MGNSVGPLNIPIQASVGDFATPLRGALRDALKGAGDELRKGFAGSFTGQGGYREPRVSKGASQAAGSQQRIAWNRAMEDPAIAIARGREGGHAYADTVSSVQWGLSHSELSAAQAARQRKDRLLRMAQSSSPLGSSIVSSLSYQQAMAAADAGSALGAGSGPSGAGGGERGGRGFSLRGVSKMLGGGAAMALRGATGILPAVGGVYYAVQQQAEAARQARLTGMPLGLGGGQYQALERRAYYGGADMGRVGTGIANMRDVLGAASRGGPENKLESEMVFRLGIAGMSTADALAKLSTMSLSTSDSLRLFGDSAIEVGKVLGQPPKNKYSESPFEPSRADNALNEEDKQTWEGAKNLAASGWHGTKFIAAGVTGLLSGVGYGAGQDEYYRMLEGKTKEDEEAAAKQAQKESQKAHNLALQGEGQKLMQGELADPMQQLRLSAQHNKEIYETGGFGKVGSGPKIASARNLGLAAGRYEDSLIPHAGMAGAYESRSSEGYSQVASAIFANDVAKNAENQTVAILSEMNITNKEMLLLMQRQRGFRQNPGVNEGPN